MASHKSKYHKISDKTSNSRKVLLPHPAFGNNIPKFKEGNETENLSNDSLSESSENMEDNTKTKKRSHSDEDLTEESDSDNDGKVKRTKTEKSINEESTDELVIRLVNVAAGLIKDLHQVSKKLNNLETEMEQVHRTFGKVAKGMNKAEDKIDENKRSINREKTFHQVGGSGIHMEMKRFYQKIMDENSILIKDLKETQKTVDVI